jgi:hypothetical protein
MTIDHRDCDSSKPVPGCTAGSLNHLRLLESAALKQKHRPEAGVFATNPDFDQ